MFSDARQTKLSNALTVQIGLEARRYSIEQEQSILSVNSVTIIVAESDHISFRTS